MELISKINIGGIDYDIRDKVLEEEVSKINPIINQGTINNAADEEDLTSENNILKLKDRSTTYGMGYVILRKNKSFAEQLTKENTIYEIRYDFDLNNKTITIPENSILKFVGGSCSNGSIIGNNTNVLAAKYTIFNNINISGSWCPSVIYVDWMNISNKNEARDDVHSILRLQNDNIQQTIYFPNYELSFTPSEGGEPIGVEYPAQNINRKFAIISSNTHVYIPNNIIVNRNNLSGYECIEICRRYNVTIEGGGSIIGDVGNHDYISNSSSDWGMGIEIWVSNNITLKNLHFNKCIGDGIYLGGSNENVLGEFKNGCSHITIDHVDCLYNRRQGFSVTGATNYLSVTNCNMSYTGIIEGTAPKSGIDFEVNYDNQCIQNILVDNCEFQKNRGKGITFAMRKGNKNITISNCKLNSTSFDRIHEETGFKEYSLSGVYFSGELNNLIITDCEIGGVSFGIKQENIDVYPVHIYNSKLIGISHYNAEPDKTAQCDLFFHNCIFGKENFWIPTMESPIFLRCAVNIEFNNCTFKYGAIAKNPEIFVNYECVQEFTFNNCKIYNNLQGNSDLSHPNFINCTFYNSKIGKIVIHKGKTCNIVRNEIIYDNPNDFTSKSIGDITSVKNLDNLENNPTLLNVSYNSANVSVVRSFWGRYSATAANGASLIYRGNRCKSITNSNYAEPSNNIEYTISGYDSAIVSDYQDEKVYYYSSFSDGIPTRLIGVNSFKGDILLNTNDGYEYYNNGTSWIKLAKYDDVNNAINSTKGRDGGDNAKYGWYKIGNIDNYHSNITFYTKSKNEIGRKFSILVPDENSVLIVFDMLEGKDHYSNEFKVIDNILYTKRPGYTSYAYISRVLNQGTIQEPIIYIGDDSSLPSGTERTVNILPCKASTQNRLNAIVGYDGFVCFDLTLHKPFWFDSTSSTKWRDCNGNEG